jgi:hypothetical protein
MEISMARTWQVRATRAQRLAVLTVAAAALGAFAAPASAHAGLGGYEHGGHGAWGSDSHDFFQPGNLLLSRSVYQPVSGLVPGVTQLAPGCSLECFTANATGAYPEVWDNDAADEDFGVTSPIFLDQITPWGHTVNSLQVPNSLEHGVSAGEDQMVTSFSSKSELALNLSSGGKYVTFMGYLSPVDALDVSNGNTPGVIDPTNPDPDANYRVVAQVNSEGKFQFTETNAYSGNNGRAAILNEEEGANVFYMAGNAGNGKKPVAEGVITGGGAQILTPSSLPESKQTPGAPDPLGSFNITQLGLAADKPSKDNNYRGLTISGDVVYYTKGSGGNGVDTVYFLDTTGKACPTGGVGLPQPGAKLPSSGLSYVAEDLKAKKEELKPNNMCILKGFPAEPKSEAWHPFGIWFANADTAYVADEGNGENEYSTSTGEYTKAAQQQTAGLQKWVFDSAMGEWKLAYTLQGGLSLGKPYTVPGYPTGENTFTKLPWAPATDGLRNIVGRVNHNGTVTIWATTSTVSGNGDEGADPNKLVAITDPISAGTPAPWERFHTVRAASAGEVLRGVSFTPGTQSGGDASHHDHGFGWPGQDHGFDR